MNNTTLPAVNSLPDLGLLLYAQHMAETARTEAARRLFRAYLGQEAQRLANDGRKLPVPSARSVDGRASA
ncbi:MAG: hypothetical protein C0404_03250 [Verrucomicrobia bacterium]|nr:hypothetical protein [Verrucomicrobiota bacterium]